MKLLYQTHSPYARKVLVAAHELSLAGELEVVHHETSPTRRNDVVYASNPLGKVPVLICDDGLCLCDTTIICEYLDGLSRGPRIIPPGGRERLESLRLQALAQGMLDAGIAIRWETERRPPELRWPAMADGQAGKLHASFDFIEREVGLEGPVDIGKIALATALGWLVFRGLPWLGAAHPRSKRWYETFAQRPSMAATEYSGATHD
jgi:glutathione S-transferase